MVKFSQHKFKQYSTQLLGKTIEGWLNLWTTRPIDSLLFDTESVDLFCQRCGQLIGEGTQLATGCQYCHNKRLPWQRFYHLGRYDTPLSDCILQYKYAQSWKWGEIFADTLSERIAPPLDAPALVTYVPMPRVKYALRGYNQAALVAKQIAKQKQWPIEATLRRNDWRSLHRFQADKRQTLATSYEIKRKAHTKVNGKACMLIDDIYTTGATAKICSRLLLKAGAKSVTLITVARTL